MKIFPNIMVFLTAVTLVYCENVATHQGRSISNHNENFVTNYYDTNSKPVCLCYQDFNDESTVDEARTFLTDAIWNEISPVLQGLQSRKENVIIKILDSNHSHEEVFLAAAYFVNYLPFINEEPSLCAFAKIINATVAWDKYRDSQAVIDAYAEFVITLADILAATAKNAIRAAGCSAAVPKLRSETCHDYGLTYEIDDIWKVHGTGLPSAYRKITKAMYDSWNYVDQFFATMATATLSPLLKDVTLSFGAPDIYLYFNLLTTPILPQCCCPAFIKKATESFLGFQNEINRNVMETKAKYFLS